MDVTDFGRGVCYLLICSRLLPVSQTLTWDYMLRRGWYRFPPRTRPVPNLSHLKRFMAESAQNQPQALAENVRDPNSKSAGTIFLLITLDPA